MKMPHSAAGRWGWAAALTLAGLGVAGAIVWAATGGAPWRAGAGMAVLGATAATWAFFAGLALARGLLSFAWAPLGVARTFLDEALRMRVAVVFVCVLLLLLVTLPLTLDPGSPLRYRIQTFLSYTLGATGLLLSFMTIFLACGTVCHEVEDKRIYTVLSKPLSRGAYLLGKGIGLALLNALLLCVAGLAIWGFTRLLATQPALDAEDARAVAEDVLVARKTLAPEASAGLEEEVRRRIREVETNDPAFVAETGRAAFERQVRHQVELNAHNLSPHQRRTFIFTGLEQAVRDRAAVQLRMRMRTSGAPPNLELLMRIAFNGRERGIRMPVNAYLVLPVPLEEIGPDGRLELTIVHENPLAPQQTFETTATFLPGEGLEVLYAAGSFEGNLARALAMQWIKLIFLSGLGLCAATFLGFPVASLLALMVFVFASSSGYLGEALEFFGENTPGEAAKLLAAVLKAVVGVLAAVLKQFSRFAPVDAVVSGRLVEGGEVWACAGWIGLAWTGATGATAWLIFRKREVARGAS
ncbi:MAG: hypothetical protein HS116_11350 [Planctomycetes bacterium]|nr:hypothetical protein [Planctomycetota bacterium]